MRRSTRIRSRQNHQSRQHQKSRHGRADFGYDPIRMTTLDTNTGSAVTALRAISSSDPSAQRAIAAVNRLRSTLEVGWLPAIRAIRSSTALSGGVPLHAFGVVTTP